MQMELIPAADCSSTPCASPNGSPQDGFLSRTSADYSAAMKGATLAQWLEKWLGSRLTFQTVAGETPVLSLAREDSSNSQYWTANFSHWRNGASVCSLSEILEIGPIDRRYWLTPRACLGILRRAENRGKALPPPLKAALEQVAQTISQPVEDSCRKSARPSPKTIPPTNDGSDQTYIPEVSKAANTKSNRYDAESQTLLPVCIQDIGKRTGRSTTNNQHGSGISEPGDPMFTLQSGAQHGVAYHGVRRLLPVETCRLMGLPDDYLDITHRGKPASDSAKYRAVGNSIAVTILDWIARRIETVDKATAKGV